MQLERAQEEHPAPPGDEGETGFLRRNGQKLVAALLWAALIALYLWYSRSSGLGALEVVNELVTLLRDSRGGLLLYVLIYLIRPLFLFSAALLTIAAGLLFGPLWGVLIVVIAANSSALIAYAVGHFFGRGLLERDAGNRLARYTTRLRDHPFETVLTLRFLFAPYDPVSYLSGFLRIDWRAFLLATALGSIPGTVAFVLFGASIEGDLIEGAPRLDPLTLAASAAIFVASLALSRLIRRRETRREE